MKKGAKNLLEAAPGPPEINTKKKGVNYENLEIDDNKVKKWLGMIHKP